MLTELRFTAPHGAGWNLHLLPLPSGGVLVYSPCWLGDDTFARIEAVGTPEVLVAPNHFHHLALEKFRARWPGALAVASPAALPRLSKQGHPGMQPLSAAEPLLPPGVKFLAAAGARSGETFLSLPGEWVVCDAFQNYPASPTGFVGFMLRRLRIAPGLCVGTIFKHFALGDRKRYCAWLFEQLDREQPRKLHVSHGQTLEAADLPQQLKELVSRRLL